VRKYGLLENGENGHGMDRKIIESATVNQIAIVLNFALSVNLFFTKPDPILMIVTAINIIVMCSMPKKRISLS
jgi:hypothetical protein